MKNLYEDVFFNDLALEVKSVILDFDVCDREPDEVRDMIESQIDFSVDAETSRYIVENYEEQCRDALECFDYEYEDIDRIIENDFDVAAKVLKKSLIDDAIDRAYEMILPHDVEVQYVLRSHDEKDFAISGEFNILKFLGYPMDVDIESVSEDLSNEYGDDSGYYIKKEYC